MMKKVLLAALAASLLTLTPMASQADTYAPDPVNQDFAGGPGGWTHTTEYAGFCVPALLCPTVVNSWSGGGADGNGYIRTQFGTLLTTAAGTSTGVWESPAFTYNGTGGRAPATVAFDMNIRPQVSDLLNASPLNDSFYRVDLVDQASGVAVSVVPTTHLLADQGWTDLPSVTVNPAQLKLGHGYRFRITTSYHSAVAVTATGEVGYDRVRLTTAGVVGKAPNGGSGITTRKQLRHLTKTFILPGSAKVVGNNLKMKLRCPKEAAPRPCKIQVQGLAGGKFSKPATARKFVTIKADKSRVVKIRIKQAYLAKYKAAKKVWVKSTVRVGSIRVTVRKRIKLV